MKVSKLELYNALRYSLRRSEGINRLVDQLSLDLKGSPSPELEEVDLPGVIEEELDEQDDDWYVEEEEDPEDVLW